MLRDTQRSKTRVAAFPSNSAMQVYFLTSLCSLHSLSTVVRISEAQVSHAEPDTPQDWRVPEISRFFGIIIRMFAEAGAPHQVPHFHAYFQDEVAVFAIDPIEVIAGSFPQKQRRLVEAWAELHQEELRRDWELLQAGARPRPIEPLR